MASAFEGRISPNLLSLISAAVCVASVSMTRRNCDCITMDAVPDCIGVIGGVKFEFYCRVAAKRAQRVTRQDVASFVSPNVLKMRGWTLPEWTLFFSASVKGCVPLPSA